MTLQEIVLYHLFPYIGIDSLEPDDNANATNNPGLVRNDVYMAAAALTAAMQEIFALGPVALSEQRRSATLFAPTPISFTATQYSNVISGISGFQSWMIGCTMRPSGDGYDNELTSQTTLVNPYLGASGTVQATMYCDSVMLRPDEKNVMDPIEVPNIRFERPARSREEFRLLMDGPGRVGDIPPPTFGGAYYNTQKVVGDPRQYLVEAQQDVTQSILPIFIRFNPMPNRALPMQYRCKIKPPVITAAMIQAGDDATIPAIPVEWHESIFVPMAKKRFMSHPAFKNQIAAAQIMDDYKNARSALETFTPATPAAPTEYR